MTFLRGRISGSSRFVLYTLPLVLTALALATFFPPDGSTRAEGMQFIGRFHPLTVHFPIAFFLLVPILELAGLSNRFSHLRPAVEFVFGLGTVSAVAATILGWCLARSGGYSGPLLTQHMWGGISVAAEDKVDAGLGSVAKGGIAVGHQQPGEAERNDESQSVFHWSSEFVIVVGHAVQFDGEAVLPRHAVEDAEEDCVAVARFDVRENPPDAGVEHRGEHDRGGGFEILGHDRISRVNDRTRSCICEKRI